MKILILTIPFRNNYGGILQAYALQMVLKKMGHDVVTDLKPYSSASVTRRIAGVLKRIIFKYILRKNINTSVFLPFLNSKKTWNIINRHTLRFVKGNISTVDLFKGEKRPDIRTIKTYDAIIVGSDQVWRKQYSDIPAYLLNFTQGMSIRRIAYAASFGTDNFSEYSSGLIKCTAKLAKQFDAISVREDSGVSLCEKYWNVDAVHLLDPTFLLNTTDYIRSVKQDSKNISRSQGDLFAYILDQTKEKQQIVNKISSELHLTPFEILPPKVLFREDLKELEKHIFPPITQWVRSFMDAKFIITDSFHGTVFSILFNKPFITIGNQKRGMARFSSLLKTFDLENRLVSSFHYEFSPEIVFNKIDWNNINNTISDKRKESIRFLFDNLK
jgi:hypothetical protein